MESLMEFIEFIAKSDNYFPFVQLQINPCCTMSQQSQQVSSTSNKEYVPERLIFGAELLEDRVKYYQYPVEIFPGPFFSYEHVYAPGSEEIIETVRVFAVGSTFDRRFSSHFHTVRNVEIIGHIGSDKAVFDIIKNFPYADHVFIRIGRQQEPFFVSDTTFENNFDQSQVNTSIKTLKLLIDYETYQIFMRDKNPTVLARLNSIALFILNRAALCLPNLQKLWIELPLDEWNYKAVMTIVSTCEYLRENVRVGMVVDGQEIIHVSEYNINETHELPELKDSPPLFEAAGKSSSFFVLSAIATKRREQRLVMPLLARENMTENDDGTPKELLLPLFPISLTPDEPELRGLIPVPRFPWAEEKTKSQVEKNVTCEVEKKSDQSDDKKKSIAAPIQTTKNMQPKEKLENELQRETLIERPVENSSNDKSTNKIVSEKKNDKTPEEVVETQAQQMATNKAIKEQQHQLNLRKQQVTGHHLTQPPPMLPLPPSMLAFRPTCNFSPPNCFPPPSQWYGGYPYMFSPIFPPPPPPQIRRNACYGTPTGVLNNGGRRHNAGNSLQRQPQQQQQSKQKQQQRQ